MRSAMKMEHVIDPKKVILDSAGDLSGVELAANQVMIGLYKRPERTKSGIILSDITRKEDEYQGKVGLVLKMGPQAFDDTEYFKDWRVNVGDWVVGWVSDGRQTQVNDCLCRVIKDSEVRMRVDTPDRIYLREHILSNLKNLSVDDDPQLPLETKVTAAPVEETVEELKQRIADRDAKVKAALETAEAERRARLEAEARVGTVTQEVEQYKTQALTAEQKAIVNKLEAANNESTSAQRELEVALNAGEYADVAKIQARIAKTAAKIDRYESDKEVIDARAANPTQVRVDVGPRHADPTEAFLSTFSPSTQGWLRGHRSLIVSDGRGNVSLSNKAMTAHYAALDKGITPESSEYYDFLEGHVTPQRADDVEDAPAQRRSPVAAPVSRDVPNNQGRPATRIRLTAEQVEMARISGITPEAYAENLKLLQSEGKMGRTTH